LNGAESVKEAARFKPSKTKQKRSALELNIPVLIVLELLVRTSLRLFLHKRARISVVLLPPA
jgi:hypothetical protein